MPSISACVVACGDCHGGLRGRGMKSSEGKPGVRVAMSVLKFYKGTISPLVPPSCRYVPTCSEYAMDAFGKYGFARGALMTAWRISRCNPLGGSGYDPAVWERTPFARWWPFESDEEDICMNEEEELHDGDEEPGMQ